MLTQGDDGNDVVVDCVDEQALYQYPALTHPHMLTQGDDGHDVVVDSV